MSSAAQITANTINAQSSTGARTEAGHAASSKNSTVQAQPDYPSLSAPPDRRQTETAGQGLFAQRDFIRPGEEETYAKGKADLAAELAPSGTLECCLVDEIHRAMWRLRRCGQVEANLVIGLNNGNGYIFDPMEASNATAEKVQRSVDRARSQSHRLLHKCIAELRKLQIERQLRESPKVESGSFCKTEKTAPATARNAPCPCNSGEKYKRCCGKNAPPILGFARQAA